MNTISNIRNSAPIIFILGFMTTVSPLTIDMYLPAFDQMAEALGTEVGMIALSLSSYFIGLAIGQIFYGPILDRFGRKRPVYFGLSLFILASIGCLLSTSVEALIAFRFLQALGGCVSQVAAMTMVRDFFPVKDSAKVFSLLMLILSVSPLLAPTFGSWIAINFGWQAVFICLAIVAVLILLANYLFLPGGRAPDPTVSLHPKAIASNFMSVFRHPQFSTYAVSGAFAFSGLLVYVAGSPLIFMTRFGLNATEYGFVFAGLAMGLIGASQLNIWLTKRFSSQSIYQAAALVQITFAWAFFIGTFFGLLDVTLTIIMLFGFLSSIGLMNPNASALALAPFTRNAGSAAALLGFLQIGVASIASTGVGIFDPTSAVPTTAILAVTSTLGFVLLQFGKFRHRGNQLSV